MGSSTSLEVRHIAATFCRYRYHGYIHEVLVKPAIGPVDPSGERHWFGMTRPHPAPPTITRWFNHWVVMAT